MEEDLLLDEKTLKKLHTTMCEILDEIVRICEENGLQYFLVGGTLLGAVRHKGFIPWDDDLDVAMPRKDYDKFTKLCQTELSTRFYLHCTEFDPNYWISFNKVKKHGTIFETKQDSTINTPYKGVFVDVFPLDNASKERSFWQDIQAYAVKGLNSFQFRRTGATMPTKYPVGLKILSPILSLFPMPVLSRLTQRIMKLNHNDDSKYFVSLGSFINFRKQTMEKSIYFPPSKVEFEGKLYMAPRDYDYVLSRLYGDYMKVPPPEKRITHRPNRIEL